MHLCKHFIDVNDLSYVDVPKQGNDGRSLFNIVISSCAWPNILSLCFSSLYEMSHYVLGVVI
jgi:hypothetical protein